MASSSDVELLTGSSSTESSSSRMKSDLYGYLNELLPTFILAKIFGVLDNGAENRVLQECIASNVEDVHSNDVVVFAKVGCGYCSRAKKCLEELQENHPFTLKVVNVKGDPTLSASMSAYMQKALKWQLNIFDLTFPQVVIRGRYVGGADDLLQVVEDDRFSRIIQDPVTHCRENGVISWDEDLLSVASRPDLFKVPRVRGEGVWYPNWPYYVFQWTVHANLIRYISVLQICIMGLVWLLLETDGDSNPENGAMKGFQSRIALILLIFFLVDCIIFTLIGPSPFSPTGVISTYFGWKSRGNATSILPYKAVFAAYIVGTCILLDKWNKADTEELMKSARSSAQKQMVGYITNSLLLAIFRF